MSPITTWKSGQPTNIVPEAEEIFSTASMDHGGTEQVDFDMPTATAALVGGCVEKSTDTSKGCTAWAGRNVMNGVTCLTHLAGYQEH